MIIVLAAMSEEKDAILSKMSDIKKIEDNDLLEEAYSCKHNGEDVIISVCGIGKTNATITTTLLIKKYKPKLLVNLGCAGSLSKDIVVQDTIVANKIAHWDIEIPWPDWKQSYDNSLFSFELDKKVLDIVSEMDIKGLHIGSGVTGDSFIYKKDQVDYIKQNFPEAMFGEMEGGSIAQTCAKLNTPCTIIRSISDCTLVNNDYLNFDFNFEEACKCGTEILLEIIKRY